MAEFKDKISQDVNTHRVKENIGAHLLERAHTEVSDLKSELEQVDITTILTFLKKARRELAPGDKTTFMNVYNKYGSALIVAIEMGLIRLGYDFPGGAKGLLSRPGNKKQTGICIGQFQSDRNKANPSEKTGKDGRAGYETIDKLIKAIALKQGGSPLSITQPNYNVAPRAKTKSTTGGGSI